MWTFVVCFLLAGSPRLFAMALSDDLWLILTVAFGAGLAVAAVNPILMSVGYERIPAAVRGRVLGVIGALSFAGIPLGGLLGAYLQRRTWDHQNEVRVQEASL